MVGGGVQDIPVDFEPSAYIVRAYNNSECRTPLILASEDGDSFQSVAKLARDKGCAVWTIELEDSKSERNATDYLDVGLQNGDWVYLTNLENASDATLRHIAATLSTLQPDPKKYPRRELFRLWMVVDKHIDLNRNVDPVIPQLLAQYSIVAKKRTDDNSPGKWVRRMPQEPPLFEAETQKRTIRRDKGHESDSESDCDEPGENKIVGKWFHRAVDFHLADAGSTITKASEDIFTSIENDDAASVTELCGSGQLNLSRLKHKATGMNLLQYACSLEKVAAAKALLEAGMDPNIVRESDGSPILFMSLESQDLVQALIDHGADYEARFETYTLDRHPATHPLIASLVRDLKGMSAKK